MFFLFIKFSYISRNNSSIEINSNIIVLVHKGECNELLYYKTNDGTVQNRKSKKSVAIYNRIWNNHICRCEINSISHFLFKLIIGRRYTKKKRDFFFKYFCLFIYHVLIYNNVCWLERTQKADRADREEGSCSRELGKLKYACNF